MIALSRAGVGVDPRQAVDPAADRMRAYQGAMTMFDLVVRKMNNDCAALSQTWAIDYTMPTMDLPALADALAALPAQPPLPMPPAK